MFDGKWGRGGGREAFGTRLLKTYNEDQVKMKVAERGLCFEFVMSSQTSYLKVVLDIYLAIAMFSQFVSQ